MNTWLILIVLGVIMLIVGVAAEAARFMIWVGIAVLVISLILSLVTRGRSKGGV